MHFQDTGHYVAAIYKLVVYLAANACSTRTYAVCVAPVLLCCNANVMCDRALWIYTCQLASAGLYTLRAKTTLSACTLGIFWIEEQLG